MSRAKQTPAQLKNLPQYRNKTKEELEEISENLYYGNTEARVQETLDTIINDYDVSDLNANDEMSLQNLAQIFVRLDHVERLIDAAMTSRDSIEVQRLNNIASVLRKDASQLQGDLNITRRARKGDDDLNVLDQWEDLKRRATKHMESRLAYVFCPTCKMLVANIWCLDWEANNVLRFHCTRVVDRDSGTTCDTKFRVTSKELRENKHKNIESVLAV